MATDTPPADPPLLPGSPLGRRLDDHLRESLTVLREQAQDPAVRRRIDEVLRGNASLRELAGDEAFGVMMTPLVEGGLRRLDDLTPQERELVAADAESLGGGGPVLAEREATHATEPAEAADAPDRSTRPPAPEGGTW